MRMQCMHGARLTSHDGSPRSAHPAVRADGFLVLPFGTSGVCSVNVVREQKREEKERRGTRGPCCGRTTPAVGPFTNSGCSSMMTTCWTLALLAGFWAWWEESQGLLARFGIPPGRLLTRDRACQAQHSLAGPLWLLGLVGRISRASALCKWAVRHAVCSS